MAHLLASAAIPFMFPAVTLPLQGAYEWFGDGSMRQTAPISPAIHLGADRILVIGAGRMREPPGPRVMAPSPYPSIAQIGGHALSSIFLDALAVDAERLQRINATLALIPEDVRAQAALKPVRLLLISPSERLDDIAGRHLDALPALDPRAAGRHRRVQRRPGQQRLGAGQLPAVRGGLHARADGARREGHRGASRRGARVLRPGARRGRAA